MKKIGQAEPADPKYVYSNERARRDLQNRYAEGGYPEPAKKVIPETDFYQKGQKFFLSHLSKLEPSTPGGRGVDSGQFECADSGKNREKLLAHREVGENQEFLEEIFLDKKWYRARGTLNYPYSFDRARRDLQFEYR